MLKVSRKNNKKVIYPLLILVVLVGIFFVLRQMNAFHLFSQPASTVSTSDKSAHTTSTLPTAQSDYTGGSPRSTQTTDIAPGTVADNQGQVSTTPPSTQWSTSPNGAITVYSPVQNSVLHSGDTLSGAATGDRVSFRLIDNVSGVISQGSLSVVNGKFSGTFNFSTKATEGRVDVFNQAADGTESNNVSVQVKL